MADITREVAIERLKSLKITHIGDFGWDTTGVKALDFAISDMKRVEELKNKNITLKESLTNTLKTNEGYRSELKHFKNMSKEFETENKRLKDGIEKVKAEIDEELNLSCTITDGFTRGRSTGYSIALSIVNKYLGE